MKKILIVLLLGIVWLPVTAAAQQWVEPYMRGDGTYVEGHWATPKDGWQNSYSTPGSLNPFSGQFNTYGRRKPGPSSAPASRSYSGIPGSSPSKNASNQYAIPGSTPSKNASNPYAIPGSTPQKDAQNP